MNITTTQRARCFVSRAMISLDITPAAARAKKSATPDGVMRIATDQPVPTVAKTERANVQVFVNAAMATKARDVTNANHTQDVKMATAKHHGSVAVTRTGVGYFVTKVSSLFITLQIGFF